MIPRLPPRARLLRPRCSALIARKIVSRARVCVAVGDVCMSACRRYVRVYECECVCQCLCVKEKERGDCMSFFHVIFFLPSPVSAQHSRFLVVYAGTTCTYANIHANNLRNWPVYSGLLIFLGCFVMCSFDDYGFQRRLSW